MTEIETARLRLRGWKESDLEAYARIAADPLVTRYLAHGEPLTVEQARRAFEWFASHWEEHGYGIWAVEDRETGELIGRIGLARHDDWPEGDDKVEVGWVLARSHWGRGLATEGALASVRYGFETLGLSRIISIVQAPNAASRRVMEKAGLTYQGQSHWRGHDVLWYAIDRTVWEDRAQVV